MTKAVAEKNPPTATNKTEGGEQAKKPRAISHPNDVAQLVMMRIDHVNSKKDELTIAGKALADTAKQLVRVYAQQQAQIVKLSKQVEEMKKEKGE